MTRKRGKSRPHAAKWSLLLLLLLALLTTRAVRGIVTPDDPAGTLRPVAGGPAPEAPPATTTAQADGARTPDSSALVDDKIDRSMDSVAALSAGEGLASHRVEADNDEPVAAAPIPAHGAASSGGDADIVGATRTGADPVDVETPATSPQRVTEIHDHEARAPRTDHMDEDIDLIDIPMGLFEVVDVDSGGGKRQNYASLDAGATILDSSPETKSPTNLLVPDKDRYMLIPCENPRKWVVISLSEDVHADAIAIANFEKFSSPVKDFIVLGSVNYPTDTWFVLGNFTAAHTSGEQIFQLDSLQHVRYIKLRFLSHYGTEYYCTLSQLRVFGRTFTQVISQLEKSIDAEVGGLNSPAALPVPPLPRSTKSAEISVPRIPDPAELTSQCLAEKNNTVVTVFYDEDQQVEHYQHHGMCCLVDYVPDQATSEDSGNPSATEQAPSTNSDPNASDQPDSTQSSNSVTSGVSDFNTDASSVPTADAGTPNATASSLIAPQSPSAPASNGERNAGAPSSQGLGRLESIFVRITKKIQALEVNQSVFGRQVEEFHAHQRAAIKMLQLNQESLNDQLKEIRTMIVDLKDHVGKELASNEQTLRHYAQMLDELRRDNIALWNEMLIVREVITTMKAGILCAIILSAFIITFYLLRLLFRCVSKCKERADLREWFWRMESQDSTSAKKTPAGGDMGTGALRVNRKQQFGSSWDDSAIERKTLVSDMGEGPHKFRRHRNKRAPRATSNQGAAAAPHRSKK